jgi:hypothetical protein
MSLSRNERKNVPFAPSFREFPWIFKIAVFKSVQLTSAAVYFDVVE